PDDRVWLQVEETRPPPALGVVQKVIEREWSKPMPQIVGARVVLFESAAPGQSTTRPANGAAERVWFIMLGNATILAYDGRSWLVQQHPNVLTGEVPNHGRPDRGAPCCLAAGCAFFPDATGVLVFDGSHWSSETIANRPNAGS